MKKEPDLVAKQLNNMPMIEAEISLKGTGRLERVQMLVATGSPTAFLSPSDGARLGWLGPADGPPVPLVWEGRTSRGDMANARVTLKGAKGRIELGEREIGVAQERYYPSDRPSVLGMDLVENLTLEVPAEANRENLKELLADPPGAKFPAPNGSGVLDTMDLPDQGDLRAQLLIDHMGIQYLCFLTESDEVYDRWLMTPAHPDKLRRTLNRESPIRSAIGNADFLVIQDRNRAGEDSYSPWLNKTWLFMPAHPASTEEGEGIEMSSIPNFIDAPPETQAQWATVVQESWAKLGW